MFKLLINRIWDHLAVCCFKVKYCTNEKIVLREDMCLLEMNSVYSSNHDHTTKKGAIPGPNPVPLLAKQSHSSLRILRRKIWATAGNEVIARGRKWAGEGNDFNAFIFFFILYEKPKLRQCWQLTTVN